MIAFICTFFQALNVPVFWPILVMYFIILFTITMKRQIKVSTSQVLRQYLQALKRVKVLKQCKYLNVALKAKTT